SKIDWGLLYYRSSNQVTFSDLPQYLWREYNNYYLARLKFPFDKTRSLRATIGPRFDRLVVTSRSRAALEFDDIKTTYGQVSLEYVYDNAINPATNIWHGLRYK